MLDQTIPIPTHTMTWAINFRLDDLRSNSLVSSMYIAVAMAARIICVGWLLMILNAITIKPLDMLNNSIVYNIVTLDLVKWSGSFCSAFCRGFFK